jgi:hypothetical protein
MIRAIVRDAGILGGRWRLEGTSVPIALIPMRLTSAQRTPWVNISSCS